MCSAESILATPYSPHLLRSYQGLTGEERDFESDLQERRETSNDDKDEQHAQLVVAAPEASQGGKQVEAPHDHKHGGRVVLGRVLQDYPACNQGSAHNDVDSDGYAHGKTWQA